MPEDYNLYELDYYTKDKKNAGGYDIHVTINGEKDGKPVTKTIYFGETWKGIHAYARFYSPDLGKIKSISFRTDTDDDMTIDYFKLTNLKDGTSTTFKCGYKTYWKNGPITLDKPIESPVANDAGQYEYQLMIQTSDINTADLANSNDATITVNGTNASVQSPPIVKQCGASAVGRNKKATLSFNSLIDIGDITSIEIKKTPKVDKGKEIYDSWCVDYVDVKAPSGQKRFNINTWIGDNSNSDDLQRTGMNTFSADLVNYEVEVTMLNSPVQEAACTLSLVGDKDTIMPQRTSLYSVNSSDKAFSSGTTNKFTFSGKDVGRIKNIIFSRDCDGFSVTSIKINNDKYMCSNMAGDKNTPIVIDTTSVKAKPTQYTVTMKTGAAEGLQLSEGGVGVVLYGDLGHTSEHILYENDSIFNREQVDRLEFEDVNVGTLTKIQFELIAGSNRDKDGWGVKYFMVYSNDRSYSTDFTAVHLRQQLDPVTYPLYISNKGAFIFEDVNAGVMLFVFGGLGLAMAFLVVFVIRRKKKEATTE
ncbi:MAG: hypothetical protein HUJ62_05260 [Streptococcus gallolyticus]|nr:hypothetical protein [Streptococcus gallolyticus]